MLQDLPLQSGDLVFIAVKNLLYRKVAQSTGSLASHVGILFNDPQKGWVVAESAVPIVRYTTLEKFLARSDRGWYAVRRVKGGLAPDQCQALRDACNGKLGILYHFGFRFESGRQFCSKLVYESYLAATGIKAGTLESFRQLLAARPHTSLGFWRLWFFGFIPWNRLTVTPASQMTCERFETVIERAQAA
jgi:hypothetical protein